jgi:hypothetical protein
VSITWNASAISEPALSGTFFALISTGSLPPFDVSVLGNVTGASFATIGGLTPETQYTLSMIAVNADGNSTASGPVTFTTLLRTSPFSFHHPLHLADEHFPVCCETAPSLSVQFPPGLVLDCAPNLVTEPSSTGQASGSDQCGVPLTITSNDVTIGNLGCPQNFNISRTWNAVDVCTRSVSQVQVISVVDRTPPVFTLVPANSTLSCNDTASIDQLLASLATATDTCDAQPTITFNDTVTQSPLCPQSRNISREWIAKDACNNSVNATQLVQIIMPFAPTLILPPSVAIPCGVAAFPNVTGQANATSVCGVNVTVFFNDSAVPGPCSDGSGNITRVWTAQDSTFNLIAKRVVVVSLTAFLQIVETLLRESRTLRTLSRWVSFASLRLISTSPATLRRILSSLAMRHSPAPATRAVQRRRSPTHASTARVLATLPSSDCGS